MEFQVEDGIEVGCEVEVRDKAEVGDEVEVEYGDEVEDEVEVEDGRSSGSGRVKADKDEVIDLIETGNTIGDKLGDKLEVGDEGRYNVGDGNGDDIEFGNYHD